MSIGISCSGYQAPAPSAAAGKDAADGSHQRWGLAAGRPGRDAVVQLYADGWVTAERTTAVGCRNSRPSSFPLEPGNDLAEDEAAASADEDARHPLGLQVVDRPQAAIQAQGKRLSPEQGQRITLLTLTGAMYGNIRIRKLV